METLHPREIDLGLTRTAEVARRLNLSSSQATVITVAGTNGKGSCITSLAALLTANGKACGAYTSPHLLHYNERIRVNQKAVSDEDICAAFEQIQQARGDISLTYFEFGTLAALLIFQQQNLPFWLLEVGLGGRLDAVNIVDPSLAIITSIDLDHEQWLGHTREAIAIEKAGILRPKIPCVCSDFNPPLSLLDVIDGNACEYFQIGEHFYYDNNLTLHLSAQRKIAKLVSHLPEASVTAACQALHILGELPPEPLLQDVVAGIRLPGRFHEIIRGAQHFIFDVAHNPAATRMLAARLQQRGYTQVTAIVAMMDDKAIGDALEPLVPFVSQWYPCELSDVSRAAKVTRMCKELLALGCATQQITSVASVSAALGLMQNNSNVGKELVLVFGSFYTVAAAYQALNVNSL